MGTTWVLDTETKGTGANMVPLERATKRSSEPPRRFVVPERRRPQTQEPKSPGPRSFRIIDVMTRQTLADGASTRDAIEALRSVRSVVDVTVYIRDDEQDRWVLLPYGEQRALFDLARAHAVASRNPV